MYMEALMAMFSIEIFVTNVWGTVVLAVLFVVNTTIGCCSKISRCAMYASTPPTDSNDGMTVNNPISHSNRATETGMELSKIA